MWLFIHRPFEVWPALGTLQIERCYMILMLLIWLFSPKGLVRNRNHWVTAIFSILLLLTWLVSPYMSETRCSGTVEDYFKVLVFYVLVVTTVRDERDLKRLITMFIGAVGLYMLHSLREYLCGRYEYRMGIRRMLGVDTSFGDPNSFAGSLLNTLPLALSLWMDKPSKGMRRLLAWYTAGTCVCIALTGSRTGFAGLGLFSLLTLMVWVRRKGLVLVFAAAGGVAALGLATVALPDELQNRYLTLIDSSYGPKNAATSAHSRLDYFLEAVGAWQSSLIIGHGPRSFDYMSKNKQGTHNLYGQVLCEMGALGALALAAYVVCFLLNWREIRRYYERHPERPPDFIFYLSRNMAILLVLLLVLGFAGHTLYRYNWRWFAAFQAIAVHCVRTRPREGQDRWRLGTAGVSVNPLAA